MKKSIRRQLIIAFLGLAIIPLLLLGGIFSWLSYEAIESEALKLQSEMAKEPAVRLDTLLTDASNSLSLAADMYFLNRQNPDAAMAFLKMLMVRDPFEKILLLDEPTTGVDPVSRREFWNILTELHVQGTKSDRSHVVL